jgi:hypothetical protein
MPNLNLYGGNVPYMINSGTFGRCRHGHTHAIPCWRCGVVHPLQFLQHWWSELRT